MTPSEILSWDEIEHHVYFNDGSLRDIYIRDMGLAEWRAWAGFVNSRYQTRFCIGDLALDQIDIDKVMRYWEGADDQYPTLTFFIGNIEVRGYFWDKEELECDFQPKDIRSITEHRLLVDYLTSISKLLDRSVEVTEEKYSDDARILMRVTSGEVDFPWHR